ncbi:hypothetical protein NMY22_g6576 [Coprinellus aureogranulatus]|nr:hypothetical protein NMY22_g6576 [Coprinellus aureogranulatus]
MPQNLGDPISSSFRSEDSLSSSRSLNQDGVAIIGMALRAPGAASADELWRLACSGSSTLSPIPPDRFDASTYQDGTVRGIALKAKTGNFMDGLHDFDNEYFNVSPREAKIMDPQQRLLLHVAYEALEDAGFVPHSSHSTDPDHVGVFIGAATNDYVHNVRDDIDIHYVSGTLPAFLSGRISYALSLGGPSTVYDTACSSSGVALHAAVRALRNDDCRMALAGGVNAITSPDLFIGLDAGGFLSRNGQSKPFDAEADGYSRGEGCILFVLKRLPDAHLDDDRILGIIRGIEANQSYNNSSITRTHSPTQSALLRRLFQNTHLEPTDVDVLEAHAAGTRQGDTSELLAIRDVFVDGSETRHKPLYLTSVKASIGHLEGASGAAGLAKVLLMLRHRTVPPQIGIRKVNNAMDTIPFQAVAIPFVSTPWLERIDSRPRRAIVNNYGAAGSNVSMLIEEYVGPEKVAPDGKSASELVLGLSAKSEQALLNLEERYVAWLEDPSNEAPLLDFCYSSTARRQLHDYRVSVTAPRGDKAELVRRLKAAKIAQVSPEAPDVVFVYAGHGCQSPGFGRVLYESSSIFRRCIDECHKLVLEHGFPAFLHYLVSGDEPSDEEKGVVEHTALLSFEIALSRLWTEWGAPPSAVIGHSLGEYAALVTSGILSLKDALFLVGIRARLVQRHCAPSHSGMMVVNLPPETLEDILHEDEGFVDLVIACRNSERCLTVAGPLPHLEALRIKLHAEHGLRPKLLPVQFAYHTPAMTPMIEPFAETMEGVAFNKPTIPCSSSVTGRLLRPADEAIDSGHLLRHCIDSVQFTGATKSLANSFRRAVCWIEVGPRRTLLPLVKTIINPVSDKTAMFVDSPTTSMGPWTALAKGLSRLYCTSLPVAWKRVFSSFGRPRCISLPPYPFQSQAFYVPHRDPSAGRPVPAPVHTLMPLSLLLTSPSVPSVQDGGQVFLKVPSEHVTAYSASHLVASIPMCPASLYLEVIFSGIPMVDQSGTRSASEQLSIRKLEFVEPCVPGEHISPNMTMVAWRIRKNEYNFIFHSHLADGEWDATGRGGTLHAKGQCQRQRIEQGNGVIGIDPSHILQRVQHLNPAVREDVEAFSAKSVYNLMFPRVVEYGPSLRSLRRVVIAGDRSEGYAVISPPEAMACNSPSIHPSLLDAMIHFPGFIVNLDAGQGSLFVCSGIGSVEVVPNAFTDPKDSARQSYHAYTEISSPTNDCCTASTFVSTSDGQKVVGVLKNIQFKRVSRHTFASHMRKSRASSAIEANSSRDNRASASHRICDQSSSPTSRSPLSLKSILCASLQIPEERIIDASSLEALGMDSLTSVEVLHILRTRYDPTLPPRVLPSVHDRTVAPYRKLEDMGRPVWGIRTHGVEAGWEAIEEMAAHYASEISNSFSDGVILGGWSFGGVVAFEVAKQLLSTGFPVGGLVLLDAPPPSGEVILSHDLIASICAKGKEEERRNVLEKQLARHAFIFSRYQGTRLESPAPLPCVYVRCAEGYLAPTGDHVHEWYTARENIESTVSEWRPLLWGELAILDVPAHHFEMFHSSKIPRTSHAIREACGLVELGSSKAGE